MSGGDLCILMFLLWTFVGRRVECERVTGVLHAQVELRGHYRHSPDVARVEWSKYKLRNSTKILICVVEMPNNIKYTQPSENISCLQNMSLIFNYLTAEHEGIYEERNVFNNNTFNSFNFTLSLLPVSKISVSSSPGSLTLTCDINGEFKLVQWFRNNTTLPDDQRLSLTDSNKTMQVSNLSSSDCGTYKCQVSNENGSSEAHINISDDVCQEYSTNPSNINHILFLAGFSLIGLVVLSIILIYICKSYGHKKVKPTSGDDPIYSEATFNQEQPATLHVNPLLIVYQDFIVPKGSHQSEDFGYSTITDVANVPSLPPT